MRLPCLLPFVLALASCTPHQHEMPVPTSNISSLEYDLYAEVIRAQHTDIFTPDSTTPYSCPPAS